MQTSREGFKYTRYLFKPIAGAKTGGCHADVFLPENTDRSVPVAICYHGGGFTICDTQHIFCGHVGYLRDQGFAVVSLEYRLAPHARFPEIREDVLDGYRWVLDDLPRLALVDSSRRFVFGGSAGGCAIFYLCIDALAASLSLPLANYVAFPLTDLTSMPQEASYEKAIASLSPEDRAKVDALMAEGVTTGHDFLSEDLDVSSGRMIWFQKMIETGALIEYMTGSAPPYPALHSPLQNLHDKFPPTVLVLAEADTDISPAHTQDAADALAALGVETKLLWGKDMPHAGIAPQRSGSDDWKRWWDSVSVPALDFCVDKVRRCDDPLLASP